MKKLLVLFLIGVMFGCSGCRSLESVSSSLEQSDFLSVEEPKTSMAEESVLESSSPSFSEEEEIDLTKVNRFRSDYDFGTCRKLSGEVSVVLFYMDDFESEWTRAEIERFTKNEVKPGLAFLEKEAQKYGVDLKLTIKETHSSLFYDDEVVVSTKLTGLATIDVLDQAAKALKYGSENQMIKRLKNRFKSEEVVCFTIFDKQGTAYAINPKRGTDFSTEEHCIIFARDLGSSGNDPVGCQSSVIAHEMLHLFGAEDYYTTAQRKALAQKQYPGDIMISANYYISTNNIGDATAFYVGWTNEVPNVLYHENW